MTRDRLILDMHECLRCQVQLAMMATAVPIIEMHLNLAVFYREQITALAALGG